MPETIQFHLNENISLVVANSLRRRGINVTTTPEEGLIAVADEVQLAFARSQGRVMFTQDADFLRLRQAGADHVGIVYCIQGSRSIGEIIRGLVLIWELLESADMVRCVEFI